MQTINFPEVVTSNLVDTLDFGIEKCERIISSLETSELDIFGSGSISDKELKRNTLITKAINNLVVSHLVNKGYPLIQQEVFNLTRWFKVAFPKEGGAYILEDSMLEPDWAQVKKQENGVHVRWCQTPYLVSVNTGSSRKTATLGTLGYVGKRNTELQLKSDLPCAMPLELESLKNKFMSELHLVAHKGYSSSIIAKYLTNSSRYYYSSNDQTITLKMDAKIYWAPKLENVYTFEQVIPPPGDPVLVIEWKDSKFFIGAWDTNTDEDRLNSIISEFVI